MSLRSKIILAMLLTSLVSVAIVGAVTYERVMSRFSELRLAGAQRSFHDMVQAYVRTYGSWAAGEAVEPFPDFTRRRIEAFHPMGAPGMGRPDMQGPGMRGMMGPGMHGPGMGSPGMEGRRGPPPDNGLPHEPPFQFLFFDIDGHALVRAAPYDAGDIVRPEDRQGAEPITVDGKLVGYALPHGQLNFSEPELQFLDEMREALLIGTAVAVALALTLGLAIGAGITRPLGRLTRAIEAMERGVLHQQVAVGTGGEIGALTSAFNRMSGQLARNHASLELSHRTMATQAEELRELSVRDTLTTLHNRAHFDVESAKMFEETVRDGRSMSMVLGDIDHFKQINDSFSHATGDAVLRRIGEMLRANLRGSDQVARYGGEEFVIAFRDTTLDQAHLLCERLRQQIEGANWRDIHPDLRVTMSMGVTADVDLGSHEKMLHAADMLLYRAKSSGRNRVCLALTPDPIAS